MDFDKELAKYGLTRERYEKSLVDISEFMSGNSEDTWENIIARNRIKIGRDVLRKGCQTIFGSYFVRKYLEDKRIKENSTNQEDNIKEIDELQRQYRQETAINKDGSLSSNKLLLITEEQTKDPEFLLKAHGFDVHSWELTSARNNIWNVYSKQDGIQNLYSSKIVVKPKTFQITKDDIKDWFVELDRNYSLPSYEIKKYTDGDKMLLIDIADLHLNLQASFFVTGNEYTIKIAEQMFFYCINDILSRTSHYDFDEIVFIIGGDMLNADNLAGTTTKGTPQSNDVHLYEAYKKCCAMIIKAIDMMKEYCQCKVKVIHCGGNHDKSCGFMLAMYVDAWFREDENVEVDYSPLPRKYYVFGQTLFMFAHDANVREIPKIISNEAREYLAVTNMTEVLLQHLHTETVMGEDHNLRIQRLPTISASSEWTVEKGYGARRQAKSFIYDKENGLTDVLYTFINPNKFKEQEQN